MGRVGGGAKTNPPESFVTRNYLSPSSFSLSKIARFGEFQECCELQGQTQPVMVSASPTRRISTNREVRVPRFEDCFESNFEMSRATTVKFRSWHVRESGCSARFSVETSSAARLTGA